MADESTFDVNGMPTVYYYVDKQSQEVAAIYMYSIFGITAMDQETKDWRPASREEEAFSGVLEGKYDVYSYDWASEEYSDDDMDLEDSNSWVPKTVKDWGNGATVTVDDIMSHTKKLDEQFISAEEAAELPGE